MTIDSTLFTLKLMYRRPKFLELLLEIREQMARDADYDVDLFAEMVRSGKFSSEQEKFSIEVRDPENRPSKNKQNKRSKD